MSDYNQTEELELGDLDGSEYVLILKDGVLYRVKAGILAQAPPPAEEEPEV